MVPGEGLEPSLCCQNWILSPARLPIPPSRRFEREERPKTGRCPRDVETALSRKRQYTTNGARLMPCDARSTHLFPFGFRLRTTARADRADAGDRTRCEPSAPPP